MPVKIKRPVGRPSQVQKIIENTLLGVILDLQSWQKLNKKVASGVSIDSYILTIIRRSKSTLVGAIGNTAKWINFALFGRGAGKPPPIEKIVIWMKQKGISNRDFKTGKFKSRLEVARSIAYAIARGGTRAVNLKRQFRTAIVRKNTKKAIREGMPEFVKNQAQLFVTQIATELDKVQGIKVNTSVKR